LLKDRKAQNLFGVEDQNPRGVVVSEEDSYLVPCQVPLTT
jgi:hypothetical protein